GQLRAHASRDGRAVRRRLGRAGTLAGARGAPVLAPGRRLLLRRGIAARGGQGRARGGEARDDRARNRRPRARDHWRASDPGDRGAHLPAGGDRGGPVPAHRRDRGRRRRRGGPRDLRGRDPARRAPAATIDADLQARPDRPEGLMAGAGNEVPGQERQPARFAPEPGGPERTDGGIQVVENEDVEAAIRERQGQPVPAALPVLPLKEMVAFPDTLTPLAVGLERSMRLVNDVLSGERMLVLVASRDPEAEEPGPEQLYEVGVAGIVARMLKVPDGTIRILVQGTERVRIGDYVAEEPYLVARIEPLPDEIEPSPELEALTRNVQRTFTEIIEQIPYLPEELQLAVTNVDDPSSLSHLIAGALRISSEEKQELLEQVDVARRLRPRSEIL